MGKQMGRPRIEINDELFDSIIELPLIKADIAKVLKCSEDTVERYVKKRFDQTFAECQEQNRQMFRRNILAKQYELAMKSDRVMLIWLGKQYLGQSEKIESSNVLKLEDVVFGEKKKETPDQKA